MVNAKQESEKGRWLVPGEAHWEVREWESGQDFPVRETLEEMEAEAPAGIRFVALPSQLVICQLFWLDTTDEKTVADLLAMQCERRSLLRQGEVWQYRIVRREADRMLAQVLILRNTLPRGLEVEGDARFEALPRCVELPPRSVCLWRTLGMMVLALTDDTGVLYFQSLPHRALTPECCRDIQSVIWIAGGQGWAGALESLVLLGEWEEPGHLASLGLKVQRCAAPRLTHPAEPMELVPKSVRQLRRIRYRRRQVRRVAAVAGALYLVFLMAQIALAVTGNLRHRRLQAEFQRIQPEMTEHQNTARRIDALNPALDTRTYPIEVLHRLMALLPEGGVRLTRFEIVGGRVEVGGESSTAREAFDFLHAVQSADALRHVEWEEPPQPVPLPNDTTRFSIQGKLTGAYHDAEEL